MISIIVPVYNAEKFLCRCIDSIISQSFQDWELILVNDGSRDKSGQICEDYAQKDYRIKCIHKQNSGVSKARNAGLDAAKGTWITFCDSDDELLPNSLLNYSKYFHEDIDVIRGGFERITTKGIETVSLPETITSNKEQVLRLCTGLTYDGFLWNSCMRSSCIANTRFDEKISWCEDHLFTFSVMLLARKIAIIPMLQYRYYAPMVDAYKFGENLSSRFIDPEMIVLGALQELQVKQQFLAPDSTYFAVIKQNFTYKIHFAINNAVIAGRYMQAFSLTHMYLNNDFRLLLACIKNKLKHYKR